MGSANKRFHRQRRVSQSLFQISEVDFLKDAVPQEDFKPPSIFVGARVVRQTVGLHAFIDVLDLNYSREP